MTNRQGTPVWYELITDDPDAAQTFYGPIMGWSFEKPSAGLERDYRTFSAADGEGVGGVQKEPPDIPGVGRFSFVTDPQGASFYLILGDSGRDSTAFAPMQQGHCSWNELVSTDQQAALDFYSKLFGWQKAGAMPMDEMGEYTFFQSGDTTLGGMMDAPAQSTTSFWNFAFTVADIDATKRSIEDGGGTVRLGPAELPDDSGWLIRGDDPHSATVMFTGARKS